MQFQRPLFVQDYVEARSHLGRSEPRDRNLVVCRVEALVDAVDEKWSSRCDGSDAPNEPEVLPRIDLQSLKIDAGRFKLGER
jgi:hypothetical protein